MDEHRRTMIRTSSQTCTIPVEYASQYVRIKAEGKETKISCTEVGTIILHILF